MRISENSLKEAQKSLDLISEFLDKFSVLNTDDLTYDEFIEKVKSYQKSKNQYLKTFSVLLEFLIAISSKRDKESFMLEIKLGVLNYMDIFEEIKNQLTDTVVTSQLSDHEYEQELDKMVSIPAISQPNQMNSLPIEIEDMLKSIVESPEYKDFAKKHDVQNLKVISFDKNTNLSKLLTDSVPEIPKDLKNQPFEQDIPKLEEVLNDFVLVAKCKKEIVSDYKLNICLAKGSTSNSVFLSAIVNGKEKVFIKEQSADMIELITKCRNKLEEYSKTFTTNGVLN